MHEICSLCKTVICYSVKVMTAHNRQVFLQQFFFINVQALMEQHLENPISP